MSAETIAIIMTVHNRAELTERCIDELHKQIEMEHTFYVCDDGSTDETPNVLENLRAQGKDLVVIQGDGNLYWNKGMYLAMTEGIKTNHDYYLMVNDDVDFYPNAFNTMMRSFSKAGGQGGISGATKSKNDGNTTYGGRLFGDKEFLTPEGTIRECNLANWNCFLIDSQTINKVGLIDPNYWHSYGDYDYSMRMQRVGFKLYLSDQYVGECERNTNRGTFSDKRLSRRERVSLFFSPKGMSVKSIVRYSIRNFDYLGIGNLTISLLAYCKNMFSVLLL